MTKTIYSGNIVLIGHAVREIYDIKKFTHINKYNDIINRNKFTQFYNFLVYYLLYVDSTYNIIELPYVYTLDILDIFIHMINDKIIHCLKSGINIHGFYNSEPLITNIKRLIDTPVKNIYEQKISDLFSPIYSLNM